MTFIPAKPPVTFTCEVPFKVANGLVEIAKAKGWRRDMLASQFLIAAYSAYHGKGDDDSLIEAVRISVSEPASRPNAEEHEVLALRKALAESDAALAALHARAVKAEKLFADLVSEADKTVRDLQHMRSKFDTACEERDLFETTAAFLREEQKRLEQQVSNLRRDNAGLQATLDTCAAEASATIVSAKERGERLLTEIAGLSATISRLEDDLIAEQSANAASALPIEISVVPVVSRDPVAGAVPKAVRADALRNHILALRAAGNSSSEIAKLACVSTETVNAILKVLK